MMGSDKGADRVACAVPVTDAAIAVPDIVTEGKSAIACCHDEATPLLAGVDRRHAYSGACPKVTDALGPRISLRSEVKMWYLQWCV